MKGPNKRENTILLNICTERLEFLNPPSPNQIEWSAKRAGCWITLHMHDSHIYVHNCIKRKDYSIHGDIQLKYRSFFPINRLERQKGAG